MKDKLFTDKRAQENIRAAARLILTDEKPWEVGGWSRGVDLSCIEISSHSNCKNHDPETVARTMKTILVHYLQTSHPEWAEKLKHAQEMERINFNESIAIDNRIDDDTLIKDSRKPGTRSYENPLSQKMKDATWDLERLIKISSSGRPGIWLIQVQPELLAGWRKSQKELDFTREP